MRFLARTIATVVIAVGTLVMVLVVGLGDSTALGETGAWGFPVTTATVPTTSAPPQSTTTTSAPVTPIEKSAALINLTIRDFPRGSWVQVAQPGTQNTDQIAQILAATSACAGQSASTPIASVPSKQFFSFKHAKASPLVASYTYVFGPPVQTVRVAPSSHARGTCPAASALSIHRASLATRGRTLTGALAAVSPLPLGARRSGLSGYVMNFSYLARPTPMNSRTFAVLAVLADGHYLSVLSTFNTGVALQRSLVNGWIRSLAGRLHVVATAASKVRAS